MARATLSYPIPRGAIWCSGTPGRWDTSAPWGQASSQPIETQGSTFDPLPSMVLRRVIKVAGWFGGG